MNISQNKIIGIIGFGVSGIAASKECIKQGYQIKIFEKNSSLGGVWFSKSYPSCQLQTTKYSYCFSDVPHFESTSLYPNRDEIIDYLTEVCNKYNLFKYVNYNTNVIKTNFDKSKTKWNIIYKNGENETNNFECDYLIVASGFYTDNKAFNDITSDKLFNDKVYYANSFSSIGNLSEDILKDKNIVVIGNGPTGCDLATQSVKKGAKSVKLLYRTKRWLFRRYLWNKISTHYVLNRLTMKIIENINKKIYIIVVTILYYIFYVIGHKFFFKIPTPFSPITRNNLVLNDDILKMIYDQKIDYIYTNKTYITDKFVITQNENLQYDICILAIGYQSNIKFMDLDKIPYMFKHIIHPDKTNCGFIGFTATFNWAQVSELQSKWFLNYINDTNNQISKTKMIEDIKYEYIHQDNKSADYHDLAIDVYNYCDNLSNDIKLKNKYNRYNPKYWLLSPESDTWSNNS